MDSIDDERRARRIIVRKMAPKLAVIVLGLAALIFLPAGTLAYWQGWVFLAFILAPATAVLTYLTRKDPGLLARRFQTHEKEAPQKLVQTAGGLFMVALMVLPGLDRQWGWSHVPPAVVLAADAIFLWAYLFVFRVFRFNSYASRTVEVVPGQTVITTGPYALVRHPMYLGILTLYLMIPLALGSFWALLAYLPLPFILALRIRNEEEVLMRDLAGYGEYREKVPFKVLPRIW
jgi:protein-S-isoprenylcysteine O-methyltransferase Ste14